MYNKFKDRDFVAFGINVRDSRPSVKKYLERHEVTFPVLLDSDGKIEKQYGVRAHPVHFLINRQGEMIGKALGERNWMNTRNCNLIQLLLDQD